VSVGGDLDGDGYNDLVSGSDNDAFFQGVTYIFLGGATGPTAVPIVISAPPGNPGGFFGSSTACRGDVNRDGYADLVVGATGAATYAGAAFLFYGSSLGVPSTASVTFACPTGSFSYFGRSVGL
jgi:hypothetical protein